MSSLYNVETEYLDFLYSSLIKAKKEGFRQDRTKVGCYSVFGERFIHNLSNGFPLFTTKKVWWKGVVEELLWFLGGNTNNNILKSKGVHIWDEWENHNGDLGPVYGKMWRSWPDPSEVSDIQTRDQIMNCIKEIRNNPNSRRIVVSSWNPSLLPDPRKEHSQNILEGKQVLPPCHCLFQFFVKDNKLSCQMYQRSNDMFLGFPFNIASYSLLTHIVANICDLEVGEFIHVIGDAHIYSNHVSAIEQQIVREPYPFPELKIKRKLTLEDLDINNFNITIDDFELINYKHHPAIKAEVAI